MFQTFDRDGNGLISAAELRYIMSNLGQLLDVKEANEMIETVDKDGDGQIDFTEFVEMMQREESENNGCNKKAEEMVE